jgi:hypothetical protein
MLHRMRPWSCNGAYAAGSRGALQASLDASGHLPATPSDGRHNWQSGNFTAASEAGPHDSFGSRLESSQASTRSTRGDVAAWLAARWSSIATQQRRSAPTTFCTPRPAPGALRSCARSSPYCGPLRQLASRMEQLANRPGSTPRHADCTTTQPFGEGADAVVRCKGLGAKLRQSYQSGHTCRDFFRRERRTDCDMSLRSYHVMAHSGLELNVFERA